MSNDAATDSEAVSARHGWAGVGLIGVFWPLNWFLPGPRTHLLFFPLWLGYVLVVDALVVRRRGTSLFTRSKRDFVLLFLASAPAWWLFEAFNARTGNWTYHGKELFSDATYAVLATLSFSTVMPAVFETAALVRSFGWVRRLSRGLRLRPSPTLRIGLLAIGFVMLALVLAWPTYFYPFVWGTAFFIVEPVNQWLGRGSLFDVLAEGDWRPMVALCLGGLVCGFFWELWNYYAFPKWTYYTPGVGFWYVFEMPLIGFIGYLPFALELYALWHLFAGQRRVLQL